jgi:hypothetical protein
VKAKNRSNRPRIRSWEADPDVAKLLDLAVMTTGASLKSIVNEALRVHGPAIIRRLLTEREAPRRELETILDEQLADAEASGKSKRVLAKPSELKV